MAWINREFLLRGAAALAFCTAAPVSCAAQNTNVYSAHVVVDATREQHAISPLIYGVNWATAEQLKLLNSPLNRAGGNASTRYNWLQNCTSSANDWFFMSHSEQGTQPGESVDSFIRANRAAKAQSMVSIPIIGWVAKIKPDRSPLWSFSVAKYGAQQKTESGHPDMGNGNRGDGKEITGNDPTDANTRVDISYQKGWLEHLKTTHGSELFGGVKYYLLDNEPGIWQGTHRDVFPEGVKMEDLFRKEVGAARLVKSVDPGALVAGPEEWGWTNYLYSGYDSQWAGKNGWDKPKPDRTAHGEMDIMPWLLKQFAQAEKTDGKRLLDVFTLHFYPQAGSVGGDDDSLQTKLLRNRSTRALWDPKYKDESWIDAPVQLIPRMKQWVKQYYPGTKVGITEYNWGAEKSISGALAQADILGIFGREGVDLATRWVCPATGTPAFKAMQMYRNYDGKGGKFGSTSVSCTGSNPDELATYASREGQSLFVMLVNKKPDQPCSTSVDMSGATITGKIQAWQLTSSNQINRLEDSAANGASIRITVPAESITLLVIPTAK